MKSLQKAFILLVYLSIGFTIIHGLLFLMMISNWDLYTSLSYHYSDNLTWIILMFGLPLMGGLAFFLWVRQKKITKEIKILFVIIGTLQIVFTITTISKNLEYWGYAFKRPTLFKEILIAESLLKSSEVSNYGCTGTKDLQIKHDPYYNPEKLKGNRDPYYDNLQRPFLVFQDNANEYGNLNFEKIYDDTSLEFSSKELLEINRQIQKAGIIVKAEQNSGYDQLGQIGGIFTQFKTIDDRIFILTGLRGREVANDHYPYYEILFSVENGEYTLQKKQMYYVDMAGYEGFEYANIAPFFSLGLTVVGLFALSLMVLIRKILKIRKGM